jgi:shikimate kinase
MKKDLKQSNYKELIVLGGLPCSGKTTIARRLSKELSAVLIPDLFPQICLDGRKRLYIYLNDLRKCHDSYQKKISIAEHYFVSTLAFEKSLKFLTQKKLINSRISDLYDLKHCCGLKMYSVLLKHNVLRQPNIIFYLKVPVNISLERQKKVRRNDSAFSIWRNKKFLYEFQNFYLKNVQKYYSIKPIIIDASLSIEEIYNIISKRLKTLVKLK